MINYLKKTSKNESKYRLKERCVITGECYSTPLSSTFIKKHFKI